MKTLERYIFKKTKTFQRAGGLALSLVLSAAAFTLAADPPPRKSQRRPTKDTHTADAGRRGGGCNMSESIPLRVLGSRNYFDKASTKPTLAWFVPDSKAYPMKLMIYKYNKLSDGTPDMNNRQKIGDDIKWKSSQGISYLHLSKLPKLEEGEFYRWQVIIECDPSSPSNDLLDIGYFKVVKKPIHMQNKLKEAGNSYAQRANLYYENGFWYEALGEALKLTEATKSATLGKLGVTLLKQHTVQEEPALERQELNLKIRQRIKYRIKNLRDIAISQQ